MPEDRSGSQVEPWEIQVQEMAQRLASQSRRSGIIGFLGGMAVMAGLVAVFFAAQRAHNAAERANKENHKLTVTVQQKTAEVKQESQKAKTTTELYNATIENLQSMSPAVSASTASAIEKAFDANPNAATLLVRVYIHIHSPDQRSRAEAMANALRAAGDVVPGIDVQPASTHQDEIHYYTDDPQSVQDVTTIQQVLAKAGTVVEKRLRPRASTDKLRPRAYGLWLAD
jgi:cell division protein FtsX